MVIKGPNVIKHRNSLTEVMENHFPPKKKKSSKSHHQGEMGAACNNLKRNKDQFKLTFCYRGLTILIPLRNNDANKNTI